MLYIYSAFPTIEKEHFLEGTRVRAALETVSSYYFQCEFRKKLLLCPGSPCSQHFVKFSCEFPHWSGSELSDWYHHRRGWLPHVLPVWTAAWWVFWEQMDQGICRRAIQGRISLLHERAQPAGIAFHQEASWCGSNSLLLYLSGWI